MEVEIEETIWHDKDDDESSEYVEDSDSDSDSDFVSDEGEEPVLTGPEPETEHATEQLRNRNGELEARIKELETQLKEQRKEIRRKEKGWERERKKWEKERKKWEGYWKKAKGQITAAIKAVFAKYSEVLAPELVLYQHLWNRIEKYRFSTLDALRQEKAEEVEEVRIRLAQLSVGDNPDIKSALSEVEDLRLEYKVRVESLRPIEDMVETWRKLNLTDQPTRLKICKDWLEGRSKRTRQLYGKEVVEVSLSAIKASDDEQARLLLREAARQTYLQGYSQCAIDMGRRDIIDSRMKIPKSKNKSWAYILDYSDERNPAMVMKEAASCSVQYHLGKELGDSTWSKLPFAREWPPMEDPRGLYEKGRLFQFVKEGWERGKETVVERSNFSVKESKKLRTKLEAQMKVWRDEEIQRIQSED